MGHTATNAPLAETEHFPAATPPAVAANLVRGALIGIAESIPGVSGGTLALITGIYERLIASATALTRLPKAILGGQAKEGMRAVDWRMLIPLGLGMVAIVFTIAGTMESFVTDHPVASKSLFFGMIAVSVAIPFLEIRPGELNSKKDRNKAILISVFFAVAMLIVTAIPKSELTNPPLWVVFPAAMVAICALVLPGVSGSFFLLVIGLYAPTMSAVDDLNLAYLLTFAAGAATGLVLFVRLLERLLETHHAMTLAAMSGLLLGSLRALWPWQDGTGGALAPGSDWPMALLLALVGAIVVGFVVIAQRRFSPTVETS
ncbi:DUF368 domain-containing protein [Corynebacterium sp. TAE3-ERU12]|nr:DUF368 domain-containing protein [Corynebacterium sp. TAE3-ERU12]